MHTLYDEHRRLCALNLYWCWSLMSATNTCLFQYHQRTRVQWFISIFAAQNYSESAKWLSTVSQCMPKRIYFASEIFGKMKINTEAKQMRANQSSGESITMKRYSPLLRQVSFFFSFVWMSLQLAPINHTICLFRYSVVVHHYCAR